MSAMCHPLSSAHIACLPKMRGTQSSMFPAPGICNAWSWWVCISSTNLSLPDSTIAMASAVVHHQKLPHHVTTSPPPFTKKKKIFCWLRILDAQWRLFSAFDPSSSKHQWSALVVTWRSLDETHTNREDLNSTQNDSPTFPSWNEPLDLLAVRWQCEPPSCCADPSVETLQTRHSYLQSPP